MKRRIDSVLLRTHESVLPRPHRSAGRPPRGFTLVELLVVIAIIGMLMALLIPAVQMARESARRATCMNNQKQIGLAIMNFATARDRLPSGFSPHPVSTPASYACMSWVVPMLPYLEQKPLYDRIQTNILTISKPGLLSTNLTLNVLNCPSRTIPNHLGVPMYMGIPQPPAPLAYVVNAGMSDNYTPNVSQGGQLDFQANGVFFDHYSITYPGNKGPKITTDLSYINDHDGTSSTILFSENIDACDWIGPNALTPFNMAYLGQTWGQGIVWRMNKLDTSAPLIYPDYPFLLNKDLNALRQAYNNPSLPLSDQYTAKPSSAHPGVFLTTMVDGHTLALSGDIDYRVYVMIMAPWNSASESRGPNLPTPYPSNRVPYPLTWFDGTGNLRAVSESDLTK